MASWNHYDSVVLSTLGFLKHDINNPQDHCVPILDFGNGEKIKGQVVSHKCDLNIIHIFSAYLSSTLANKLKLAEWFIRNYLKLGSH